MLYDIARSHIELSVLTDHRELTLPGEVLNGGCLILELVVVVFVLISQSVSVKSNATFYNFMVRVKWVEVVA